MSENKDHWYDGRFYDRLIAPHQDAMFLRVQEIVPPQSTVLDVGCGTGRMAFQLADMCTRIDGVDLSKRNIDVAVGKLSRSPHANIAFHHSDILRFLAERGGRYDYAILTYVFHEMPEGIRPSVLQALAQSARNIILYDYLAPQPRTFAGLLNETIEYVAGADHYRGFTSFLRSGGLTGAAEVSGLSIVKDEKNNPPLSHLLVLAGTLISPCDACW